MTNTKKNDIIIIESEREVNNMEEIVKDLKEIREWYETFLDESISTQIMDSNEIDEYQILSNKFQNIIDKLSNM